MQPQDLEKRLLYRDALMLVIDKPTGLPVHKGTGGGETLEQHFEALRFGLPRPPALAHRLDKDTSGCLVLGRNRHALSTLGDLFAKNKVGKTYWAVVRGKPEPEAGVIELRLSKQSDSNRRWWMKVSEVGMDATTAYKTLAHRDGLSWLELMPRTGRTHQLRVHCAAIGCPIAGDRIYGNDTEMPLHLHARAVCVPLYPKKPAILVTAEAPPHLQKTLETLGYTPEPA